MKSPPKWVKSDPVEYSIWKRIYSLDMNMLLCLVGDTGSRKSGSACTLGLHLDKNFNLNRVVFKASDFLDLIERGEPYSIGSDFKHPYKKNLVIDGYRKLKKGSVIIWDETGVDNDNTEWYTMKSKVIKWTLTQFRYMNLIVLMTVPSLDMVSIGVRRLLHGVIQMWGPPRSKQFPSDSYAESVFYWYSHNPITGKPYRKKMVFRKDGDRNIVKPYYIPRPPVWFEEKYQKKKEFYARNWFKMYQKELNKMNLRLSGEDLKGSSGSDLLNLGVPLSQEDISVLKNAKNLMFLRGSNWSFNKALVESFLGVSPNKAAHTVSKLNALIKIGKINPDDLLNNRLFAEESSQMSFS